MGRAAVDAMSGQGESGQPLSRAMGTRPMKHALRTHLMKLAGIDDSEVQLIND